MPEDSDSTTDSYETRNRSSDDQDAALGLEGAPETGSGYLPESDAFTLENRPLGQEELIFGFKADGRNSGTR